MKRICLALLISFLMLMGIRAAFGAPVRVKELVDVQGVRENVLYGYGLVVGLAGTGDTERVFFTAQSISGMLGRMGIRINPADVQVRNVAAVMVTARLPSFSRAGTRIDITVGSMGNARSLSGGVLLITPLTGPDGQVYALGQGPVQAGGFDVGVHGSSMQKNQPTSGRVPMGATIERAVMANLEKSPMVLGLKTPDFTTSNRIAEAINAALKDATLARAADPASVEVTIPAAYKGKVVALMTAIEAIEVESDQRARIVVSERTGTVVAGDRVRIHAVAVAHGGLSISIQTIPLVSQPNALSRGGKTVQTNQSNVDAKEKKQPVVALPATTTVEELVKALNLIGASPRDLIAILQAMKAAGAIDAELDVI